MFIGEHYEQLHANILDILEDMSKFLETHNLHDLSRKKQKTWTDQQWVETESVIKTLPREDQMAYRANYTKHLKKN